MNMDPLLYDDINNLNAGNFEFRPNQITAVKNTIEQGFVSGLHMQIMGAGKTIIMLSLINNHYLISILLSKNKFC